MAVSRMDPSCTIGFYARGQKDFESLCTVVNEVCDWGIWVLIHGTFGLLERCCVAFGSNNRTCVLSGVNLSGCKQMFRTSHHLTKLHKMNLYDLIWMLPLSPIGPLHICRDIPHVYICRGT